MRPLSNAELLAVWEWAAPRSEAERALSLVAAAEPEAAIDSLARASVGQRDLLLLQLRAATFGSRLEIAGSCAECGTPFEMETRVGDLIVAPPPAEEKPHIVVADGFRIVVRLPDSTDLAAIADERTKADAARVLFTRCVIEATRDGAAVAVSELTPPAASAVAARVRELDPQADLEFAITCPECRHQWSAPFDIASFFWIEIDAWAGRLLYDVHVLAKEYGWPESEILAMSERRRQAYLDLIGA